MIVGPSPNGIEFAGKRTCLTKTWVYSQTSPRSTGNAGAADRTLKFETESENRYLGDEDLHFDDASVDFYTNVGGCFQDMQL